MEASPTAAEVVLPPRPSSPKGGAFPDPLEEFNLQLEDIIRTFGSAAALDSQGKMEAEMEKKAEAGSDITGAVEAEVAVISQSLSPFPSPQDKLDHLLRRHAELVALRRRDQQQLCAMQAESRSSVAARSRLETLCRELQQHHGRLQEETLRRCRQDEERRVEMAAHFQAKLTEIQEQIEQHSARNDKLCQENANLTGKLESIVAQCELREENLEKINKRRDLQQQLTEAKLQQADALLADAQEKHKREKEYLLREAIDKTKKCFAMKEQELAMKKKLLLQAAEWKLQTQTLTQQTTVMQAQLTLYAQKFDEFQETLAKSNEIYGRFKKEMNNMSDKMKKMEKESNVWKSRFENCNKALTDMIQERTERSQEYDLFVLKIQRLEKLCRALQEERSVLYSKIKEVRHANANPPSKLNGCDPEGVADGHAPDHAEVLSAEEVQEIQGEDPVLTDDMNRLREEQAKLQEFAASLLATPSDEEEEDKAELDPEEDAVALAFNQFKAKVPAKEDEASGPAEEPAEEVPLTSEQNSSATAPGTAEGVGVRSQVDLTEVQQVQQPPEEPTPEQVRNDPPADPEPGATEAEARGRASQGEPVAPAAEEVPAQSGPQADEAPPASESSPPSENPPPASDSNRKQTAKKKKKRSAKNAS